jgi:hypothetical protein
MPYEPGDLMTGGGQSLGGIVPGITADAGDENAHPPSL